MTIIVTFQKLQENYPKTTELTHDQLFDEIGWEDLKSNPTYANTCAIRMSLCLIRAGITLPGRMKIKKGEHKNNLIEPGQVRLSNILATPQLFGKPTKFKPSALDDTVKNKKGIISFMHIPGYVIDGALSGHIDLVHYGRYFFFFDSYSCEGHCYWDASECWFWPLP